ncbi:MAG: DNA-binding protein [Candidatus Accumulibacter sp.]|nr:DNA-binding protein [Accumulibacter sp.]
MSLESLPAIKRLVRHEATPGGIVKLRAAADRHPVYARATSISVENRFDEAYKAIMQCAMAALWAKGHRPATSEPGHHQLVIRILSKTLAVDGDVVIVLDARRKQRKLNGCSGDTASDATLAECKVQAESLIRRGREMGLGT